MPDPQMLRLAAKNLADRIGSPPANEVIVLYSPKKQSIASAISDELVLRGTRCKCIDLSLCDTQERAKVQAEVREVAGRVGLFFLISPEHFAFLFETLGRPDRGLRLKNKHVLSDFGLSVEGLVRTNAVDLDEVEAFRTRLLARLEGAREIRVMTPAGTDIRVHPRRWNSSFGEIYTAPVEGSAEGRVVVDGCAYHGPPKRPFTLVFKAGRVVNLDELDLSDEQQAIVAHDLSRDKNMPVLAEFGIGVNPGARRDADLMESEQARGTCHFGFGHNIEYGGANKASYHFDLVVRAPLFEVDGTTIKELSDDRIRRA